MSSRMKIAALRVLEHVGVRHATLGSRSVLHTGGVAPERRRWASG